MSVVLLSGRFKIGVSLPSGIEIAAEKRLFSREKAMCFCDIHDDEVFSMKAPRLNSFLEVILFNVK